MYIEFENNTPIDNDFVNKKIENARWYTRSQAALLFKDGEKFPDKFDLVLSFSGSRTDQQSISCFSAGRYELLESAYCFDNRRNPVVDFTQLKPLSDQKKTFLDKK